MKILRKIKFNVFKIIEEINKILKTLKFYFVTTYLFGISENKRSPMIVVSVTSFPERMVVIHNCLFSLLDQDFKPDELILWLGEEEFPNRDNDIPKKVLALRKNGLTIKYCNDIKSYKKLIPSLRKHPNSIIVTADDDVYYPKNWLRILYASYKKNPEFIHCNRANKMQFKKANELKPYLEWPNIINLGDESPSFSNLFNGCGGVLYPPGCFYKDILDENIFLSLCEKADDIWFWAMAVLNNTKIKVVENNISTVNDLLPNKYIGTHLWNTNSAGGNDVQMKNILKYYPELWDKIESKDY